MFLILILFSVFVKIGGKISLVLNLRICNTFCVCTVYFIQLRISKHFTQMSQSTFRFMILLPPLQETKPVKYERV